MRTKQENTIAWLIDDISTLSEEYKDDKDDMVQRLMKINAYAYAIERVMMD